MRSMSSQSVNLLILFLGRFRLQFVREYGLSLQSLPVALVKGSSKGLGGKMATYIEIKFHDRTFSTRVIRQGWGSNSHLLDLQ